MSSVATLPRILPFVVQGEVYDLIYHDPDLTIHRDSDNEGYGKTLGKDNKSW